MKKQERQRLIKQLITENDIETQDDLLALLEQAGVTATQATISRDIREMSIVKTHNEQGQIVYRLFAQNQQEQSEAKLSDSVKDSVNKLTRVEFMVVVHTEMGAADVITNFLDEVGYEEIAGTIAGVDTIIIIAHSVVQAEAIVARFEEMRQS